MEHKHFSHPHSLTFNQKPLKSEVNCSGCKLPISDTTSYACWECRFFLHPQCFHATRSIDDHPSHPSHTLTLIPYPTYPSGSFICSSCNRPGFGFSFSCSKCEFDLHVHCTNLNLKSYPNPSSSSSSDQSKQKQIQHKSHLKHALNLLSPPPYPSGEFTCNACGENGKESTFHCKICEFDLHEKCAALPEYKSREDHEHMLALRGGDLQIYRFKPVQAFASLIGLYIDDTTLNPQAPLFLSRSLLPPVTWSTGAFIAVSRYASATPLPPSVLSRGVGWQYSVQLTEGSCHTCFICDVCFRNINIDSWIYYCAKCDFGTHVNCVMAKARSKEEIALAQQVELMNIQNRVRLNAMRADIIGSAFYGPRRYYY